MNNKIAIVDPRPAYNGEKECSPILIQKINIISELIYDLHSQTELIIESLLKMSSNEAGIKILQRETEPKGKECTDRTSTFLEQLDQKVSSLHSLIEKTNIIRQHIQELI